MSSTVCSETALFQDCLLMLKIRMNLYTCDYNENSALCLNIIINKNCFLNTKTDKSDLFWEQEKADADFKLWLSTNLLEFSQFPYLYLCNK